MALTMLVPVGAASAKPNRNQNSSTTTTVAPQATTTTTAPASAPAMVAQSPSGPTTMFDVAQQIGLVGSDGKPVVAGTGEGVTIAMIDTGVVIVPGLKRSNVVLGPDFTPEDMFDDLRSLDTNGHGTHLAGIMVATDAAWDKGNTRRKSDRMLGIAPDATLISIKAGVADGGADVSQVIAAVNWVIEQKTSGETDIDVLSLAYSADSNQLYLTDPLAYAVERAWKAGIVVVVAGGNEGNDQWQLTSPAYDPFVIAVGASELTELNQKPAAFSSAGVLRPVDVHAPGSSIVSLRNPGSWSDDFNSAGRIGSDLVRASGTSQATAVVAGAVAVLLDERPDLTPDQVKQLLIDGASTVSTGDWSWPLRYIDVDESNATAPTTRSQRFLSASGKGSIDDSRGELRLNLDGVDLRGEMDIFGNNWAGSRWTTDAWTGSRWTGSRWTVDVWAAQTWAGSRWTASDWAGSRWTGSRWTATDWSGSRWTGSRWTGSRWTNVDWS